MREVIIQGATIAEAVALGRNKLGVGANDPVKSEVISYETSMIKAGRGKTALVRIWVLDGIEKEMEEELDSSPLTGPEKAMECGLDDAKKCNPLSQPRAAVVDGGLLVEHPPQGPYPVVVPCPGAQLVVNGKEQFAPTVIKSTDRVELIPREERQEGKWNVEITEAGLSAVLNLVPGIDVKRRLRDQPPSPELQLEVIEHEERFPPLTMDDLLKELQRQGISYGVDWSECARGCTLNEKITLLIACGKPPQVGRDAAIKLRFSARDKEAVVAGKEGMVDFRQRFLFTSVEAGALLAWKQPTQGGQPGIAVTGEPILPPEPRDMELKAGRDAVLSKDGLKVIAARAGRPMAKSSSGKVSIEVVPMLFHPGPLDVSSGNLTFWGDIMIGGDVQEGMTVSAGRNVLIKGTVSEAMLQAGESIRVLGNIFASVLTAGGEVAFQQGLTSLLAGVANGLEQLKVAVTQLLEHSSLGKRDLKSGIGPLVLLLLEKKFRSLPTSVELLHKEVDHVPVTGLEDELRELVATLAQRLVHSPLAIQDMEELQDLARLTALCLETLTPSRQTAGHVVLGYAINSTIMASGNIKVAGGGCYQTRLRAGNKVTIHGIFRGGEIKAGSDVYIKELGSRSGTATTVKTQPGARVTVGHAFESAEVRIGPRSYPFTREEWGVRLELDKEGHLICQRTSAASRVI